ncbi:MAG: hypothetical protein ACOYYS_19945 [Chloroflexota bacterium]
MSNPTPSCLVCQQTNATLPLIPLVYGDEHYYICPSHLPILIHQPQRLVGMLPGSENLEAHEHDH